MHTKVKLGLREKAQPPVHSAHFVQMSSIIGAFDTNTDLTQRLFICTSITRVTTVYYINEAQISRFTLHVLYIYLLVYYIAYLYT